MEKDDERGCRIPPQRPEWREERQSPPTQGEIVRVSPQLTRPQAGEEEGAEVTSPDRPQQHEEADDEVAQHGEALKTAPSG